MDYYHYYFFLSWMLLVVEGVLLMLLFLNIGGGRLAVALQVAGARQTRYSVDVMLTFS